MLLTAVALGTALVSLGLTSTGLMPVTGAPRASLAGFTADSTDLLLGVREALLIAVPATALAVVVGVVTAVLVVGSRRGARWLGPAAAAVLPVPHLVGAAAVGLLLSDSGLGARVLHVAPGSWPALVGGPLPVATVLEFAWKESAFVGIVVVAAVSRQVAVLGDTASLLGAGGLRRLRHVTLPLMAPAAAAAGVIVFLYTAGAYEVAWLLGRAYPEPLPVLAYRLFTSIDLTAHPEAAAAALVSIAVALGSAGTVLPLLHRLGAAR